MTRAELIKFVQSEASVSSPMKAAAILAISALPKVEIERLGRIVEEGMPKLRQGDIEGLLSLIEAEGLPQEYLPLARTMLSNAARSHSDQIQ